MINPFRKPYNEIETPKEKIVFILVFGLFIFLFLFLFKPFGLSQLSAETQFFVTFGFGLVTISVLSIFKYLLEPVVINDKWTLGKSLIWGLFIAVTIGIANYFYISAIFPHLFLFKYLFLAIWTAILVGIIPVTIGYIVSFNRIYKSALIDASILPDDLLWENEVIIRGGNPKNEFKFNPKNIIYLCSNDNYITVVTINGENIAKTHLRGTMKGAEWELRRNNSFFRCHKCYLINSIFADHLTGNTQNMKIRLKIHGLEIPVSRSKAPEALKKIG